MNQLASQGTEANAVPKKKDAVEGVPQF